jgi:GNAT superfamily N-acetyltransferase
MIITMLQEMTSHGGHALNKIDRVAAHLQARFTDSLEDENHVHLLAVVERPARQLVGVVEASAASRPPISRPSLILHVHALYVAPDHRRRGIGRDLLEAVLAWGRARGCAEAQLSVLTENPARKLYESLGFEPFELEMRLALETRPSATRCTGYQEAANSPER